MNSRIAVLAGLLMAGVAASGLHAQTVRGGMHGGYGTEFEGVLLGAQLRFPVSRTVDLYPSFDYHFRDGGSVMGYNADMMLRPSGSDAFYLGGGLSIIDPSDAGSDAGFSLFGGWEGRNAGTTNPYLEVRGIFHGDASLQVMLGLNFLID